MDAGGASLNGVGRAWAVAAFIMPTAGLAATPAANLDLPAGTAGQQLLQLGAVMRADIVGDAEIWRRRVPRLRGRMSAAEAMRRIARAADAVIVTLGPDSFRLVAQRRRPAVRRPRRSTTASPPASTEQDIIVTASKRDLPLGDYAGQVTRLSGDDLDLAGPGGSEAVVDRMTSIASTYLGAGRNKLFIRGIADSSFAGPTQPTVGQYLGDLRLNYNGPDPDLRLIDLSAVEVLEGPQGTLYGAGSLGGLIRLIPNAPDLDCTTARLAAGASLTRRGAPGADVQAVVNLPLLSDRAGLRVSLLRETEGGYVDKPLLGRRDANRTDITSGRAALRLDSGTGWTADVTGVAQRIRAADSQYVAPPARALVNLAPVIEGSHAGYAQGQVALSGWLGPLQLRSTTGITASALDERFDATTPDRPVRLFVQSSRARMIANETRLWRSGTGGAGWLAGVSLLHNRTRLLRLFGAPEAPEATVGGDNRVFEATLYGEGSTRLTPALLATAGLRASHVRIDGRADGEREPDDPDRPAELRPGRTLSSGQTVLLPSASLLYDLAPGLLSFVRYQTGFRPGGVAVTDDRLRRFRSDRVKTMEVGLRTGGSERTRDANFAVTVAYTAWRDIQADFLDRSGLPSTANIGDGEILTFQVTGDLRLARGLRLDGAITYNDSIISDARDRSSAFADGEELPTDLMVRLSRIPNVARMIGRVGITAEQPVASGLHLTVGAWMRYVGPSSLGLGPALGQTQGDYVDSGAAARFEADGYAVSLGLSNIADVRGDRFALGTPVATGRQQITPLRPLTVRIGFDANF